MNYNRAVMKLEVKQAMRQTRPHPMLVTLLYLVILGAGAWLISWVVNTLFPGNNAQIYALIEDIQFYGLYALERHPEVFIQLMVQSMAVSLVAGILTTVWNGLMDVGYAGYCLDMVRETNPSLERVFGGFPRAGSVVLSYILVAVFTFLWSLLLGVGFVVAVFGLGFIAASIDSYGLFILLIMAASIGYAVAIVWVVLRYAMVPYAIIDSQNPMSAMDAIRTSKAIMKGRKGSFFVLQLSFIGWYLLEYLILVAGVTIAVFAAAGSIGGLEYMIYSGGIDPIQLMTRMVGPVLIVALLCAAAIFVINLWLTPYRNGCNARFYLYATGGNQPIQSGPYSGQPGPYGGQPGPYGGQPGPYGGQPGPYGGQSGPYGSQPGPYGGQSGPYGGQPGPYGGQPSPYGGQPGPYGGQPGPYGGQSGPYGGQPGPYSGGPYGYTPLSQGSFGGYTQAEQPPQSGSGIYAQWGAPEVPAGPESPVFSETVTAPVFDEAPAAPQTPVHAAPEAPTAPAATEAPAVPEAPVVPEPFVPTKLVDPADSPYEEPYAEPEAPDDASQRPGGPSYPQY